MPLTFEGSYGVHFDCEPQKKISKKVARKQRAAKACAARFGWDDEKYEDAMKGKIAFTGDGWLDLENFLHGIDEPIVLEQDVKPFTLPHVNRSAIAAWERDLDALNASLSTIPREILEKIELLADFNYNIHWQYNEPSGTTPSDYLGDFFNEEANDCLPRTEEADEFVNFLNMLNLANSEEDIADLRASHEMVKDYCEKNDLDATTIGLNLRGIHARNVLITQVSR